MIRERDVDGLGRAITNEVVEKQVLKRLELKARTYGTDPMEEGANVAVPKINVKAVVGMYRDYVRPLLPHLAWRYGLANHVLQVIPQTKEIEIEYLLQRLNPIPKSNGV